jgi:hypothetical protein
MTRPRLALPVLVVCAPLALLAGCGDDSPSASDPASLAPADTLVYVEGAVRPTGSLKSDVDSAAEKIAGIDNLGDFVVEELESEAQEEGEPFDFEAEVEPWLGERAGISFADLEDGDLSEPVIAVESTDAEATQDFIDSQAEQSDEPYRDASHEGVDFKVGGEEDQAVGLIGDFLVIADSEAEFKEAVDVSEGDSLADEERFERAIAEVTEGSLADVYVDVGGLIERSGDEIDAQARQALQNAGIDPSDATAVASIVPGAEEIAVDLSSDLGGEDPPSGDPSELLGSLPASSFAAFAVAGFGEQLKEGLDNLDEEGIPGEVPPGQLKKGLRQAGIDLDSFAGSLQDAGVFAVGNSERSLGGALVMTSEGSEASNAIANLGGLLRGAGVAGVTALRGGTAGFSVRDEELGDKPLVVAAKGERVAIGYGLPATMTALAPPTGRTLADSPAYQDAEAALGGTPIAAFADGPAALRLADSLIPASEADFEEAKRYLRSIAYLALGSASEGDLATAKLIIGLE